MGIPPGVLEVSRSTHSTPNGHATHADRTRPRAHIETDRVDDYPPGTVTVDIDDERIDD
ncbi:hypothetical protein [Streptomyces hypolithicus]